MRQRRRRGGGEEVEATDGEEICSLRIVIVVVSSLFSRVISSLGSWLTIWYRRTALCAATPSAAMLCAAFFVCCTFVCCNSICCNDALLSTTLRTAIPYPGTPAAMLLGSGSASS